MSSNKQPFMYLDNPPKLPVYPWQADPEDLVVGFMVPWYLSKFTPIIDACHLKAIEIKFLFEFQRYCVMSKFKVIPESEREDYTSDILYMDDEEQDRCVRKLQKEDVLKNELYAKAFALIIIAPLPFIIVRLYIRWFDMMEFLCLISLILSAAGIPAVRTDSLELEMPGKLKVRAMHLNMYLSFVIAVLVTVFPPGMDTWGLRGSNGYWITDGGVFGLMPFAMAILSHIARRMMEAVNYLDMEHVRYMYLEPYRWEEIGIQAANQERLQAMYTI